MPGVVGIVSVMRCLGVLRGAVGVAGGLMEFSTVSCALSHCRRFSLSPHASHAPRPGLPSNLLALPHTFRGTWSACYVPYKSRET